MHHVASFGTEQSLAPSSSACTRSAVVLWVRIVRFSRIAQTIAQANVAQTERLIEEIRLLQYQGKHRERLVRSPEELPESEVVDEEVRDRERRVTSRSERGSPKARLGSETEVVKLRVE